MGERRQGYGLHVGIFFPNAESRQLLGVLSDLSASRVGSFVSRIGDYHALLRELGFRMEPHLVAA